jgi:hypothetical protein
MAKGKLRGRIKSAVKKAKDKTKSTVKKLKDTGGYAPLLPFKAIMVTALKRKGENVKLSTPMNKLAPLFRDVIIRKKTTRNYGDLYLENIAEEEIIGLVREVMDFIKTLVKRKENNERLSEEEKEIVTEGEKVAEDIKVKGTDAGGNWFKDNMVIILGAAAVVLFLLFRKK